MLTEKVRKLIQKTCFLSRAEAKVIYRDSSKLSLNEKGYVWLLPEEALSTDDKNLLAPTGEQYLIYKSVHFWTFVDEKQNWYS